MSMISTLLLPGVNLLPVTDRCTDRSVNRAPAERAVCRTLRTLSSLAVCTFLNVSYHCLHFSIDALPHTYNVTPVSRHLCGYDGKGTSKPAQVQTVDAGTKPGQLSSPLRHGPWPLPTDRRIDTAGALANAVCRSLGMSGESLGRRAECGMGGQFRSTGASIPLLYSSAAPFASRWLRCTFRTCRPVGSFASVVDNFMGFLRRAALAPGRRWKARQTGVRRLAG